MGFIILVFSETQERALIEVLCSYWQSISLSFLAFQAYSPGILNEYLETSSRKDIAFVEEEKQSWTFYKRTPFWESNLN